MKRIVTLTMNPAVDMSAEIDHVAAERKLRCHNPRREPGGGGINVSRAVRNLGGASTALYPAGGEMGRLLAALLDEDGIEHETIEIDGKTRENVAILETSTGRQFRFGMPGPALSEKEWRRCIDAVLRQEPEDAFVVASGSLPPGVPIEFYAILAREVKRAGGRVVLDASGDALSAAVEEGVYLIKPNMREFRHLAGRDIDCDTEQEGAALELIRKGGAEIVVVSQGVAGALVADREGSRHYRSPVVPVKSKVGAGDSMVAGLVTSLALGNLLEEAARFAVAAGAAAVMTPGSELCRGEDTTRLYEKMIKRA